MTHAATCIYSEGGMLCGGGCTHDRDESVRRQAIALEKASDALTLALDRETKLRAALMREASLTSKGGGLSPPRASPLRAIVKHLFRDIPPPPDPADWLRANGDVACEHCGLPYYAHPDAPELSGIDGEPFMKLACDGRRLKL